MDHNALIAHIETALRSIMHARFYETERGFQGALLAALREHVPTQFLSDQTIIEQEYQKRLDRHGLKIRPDIIIHEPFDETQHGGRDDGNVAVIELKLKGSQADAQEDFESLVAMMDVLAYPIGIFVNIASGHTHAGALPETAKGRITCFAVLLETDGVKVLREP
ncbi:MULTISPECIES: hypothetical protein [unclassified Variovorax]|uniref:hypothetical protein n=2 Tax=Variovorax TaxID=34072 RepID=UPI000C9AEA0E|nr:MULTISPECIES: hypothetical protein [unclassified Variovorax]PNG53304.1 hypothetical protein CHC06_04651 [Variovorax sp. B2]PNG53876.1 hypothetical protein CHC07_03698 [Variovorax sp. B4]VTV11341.1 hypothetical protein WDL1CHR_02212 [Variovorax sp. WDL1]